MENKISTKKILHYKDYKKKIATNQSEKTEPVTKHKILIKNKHVSYENEYKWSKFTK